MEYGFQSLYASILDVHIWVALHKDAELFVTRTMIAATSLNAYTQLLGQTFQRQHMFQVS